MTLRKILDLAKERLIIDQKQYHEIWEDNTLRWLFGNNNKTKQELIDKIIT